MIRRIRAVLLCDDVRTEDNQKTFLIGVYGNGVVAGTKPAAMGFVIFAALDLDGEETKIEAKLGIEGRDRNFAVSVPSGLEVANIRFPINVLMDTEKVFSFSVRNAGGEWSEPFTWNLTFSPDAVALPEEHAAQIMDLARQQKDDIAQSGETPITS